MPEHGLGNSPCCFVIGSNGSGRAVAMLSGGCFLVVVGAGVGVGLGYLDLWPIGLWVSAKTTTLGPQPGWGA